MKELKTNYLDLVLLHTSGEPKEEVKNMLKSDPDSLPKCWIKKNNNW